MQVTKYVVDREQWLLDRAKASKCGLDILDREFTDAYIEQFDPKVIRANWGAHKIPELGQLLSKLFREGKLARFRIPLGFNWQPGWPRWVYSYEFPKSSNKGNVQ
jgi:hypothetical protein